jgi:hypothetical protein
MISGAPLAVLSLVKQRLSTRATTSIGPTGTHGPAAVPSVKISAIVEPSPSVYLGIRFRL